MGRYACLLVVLGACMSQPPLTVDKSALDLPCGAGTDVEVKQAGQPMPLDELRWLVDDDTIVTVTRSRDGVRLRLFAVAEGATAIHIGSRDEVVDITTHVSPALDAHLAIVY